MYSKETLESARKSPWGDTQKDQKEGLEFDINEYREINNYCTKKNITWYFPHGIKQPSDYERV